MSTTATLTQKQARFVAEYLVDGNGTRAAVAAGYGVAGAHASASRTLRIVKVQEALQARQRADATRLSISRDDVLVGLLAAFELARQQGVPATMVSAARELGRLLGYYAPETRRVEITDDGNDTMRRMEAMSDAQLVALIGRGCETPSTP